MQIDNDLVVKIGDGELIFEEPGLNNWTTMLAMSDKPLDQQADILLEKLKAVSGLVYSDGSEATIEDIKAKKFPARFFLQVVNGWTKGVLAALNTEAEAKNESTSA